MRLLLCLAAALVFSACGGWLREPGEEPRARRTLRQDLVGCWALYGQEGRRVDTLYYNATPIVQLDSHPPALRSDTVSGMIRDARGLDTLGRVEQDAGDLLGPSWSVDSLADSLRISFVDGFSGAVFIFAAPSEAGDTLRGRVEEHWDMGPTVGERGPASAVRIPCPAEH